MTPRLRIELQGFADLEPASHRVREFLRETGVDDRRVYHADLAIEEVVVNVLRHGFAGRPAGRIAIDVDLGEDDVRLTFRDEAPPFDPWSVPSPDLQAPLEQRRAGGLGIHLVRSLARRVAYERREGCNEVRVWL